jgi:hypothetical protein
MLPENVDKRLELIEGEIYAYLKSNPIGHVTTSDGS